MHRKCSIFVSALVLAMWKTFSTVNPRTSKVINLSPSGENFFVGKIGKSFPHRSEDREKEKLIGEKLVKGMKSKIKHIGRSANARMLIHCSTLDNLFEQFLVNIY